MERKVEDRLDVAYVLSCEVLEHFEHVPLDAFLGTGSRNQVSAKDVAEFLEAREWLA